MKAAFISDIHYGKFSRTTEFSVPGEDIQDENSGGVSLEQSLIDTLKREDITYLFVGGDLTSVGSPAEFSFCGEKLLSIAATVGISPENIICCMGNHDIDWNISQLGELYVGTHSEASVNKFVKDQYQFIAAHVAEHNLPSEVLRPSRKNRIPFSGTIEREEFIVFILNTGWLCGPNQDFPHGKLKDEQLNWFRDELEKYDGDLRTKIVLMHHHPHQYPYPVPTADPSLIEDGAEFLEIAGKYGINLVLHGHRHHPRAATMEGDTWKRPITFICAGSLSVNAIGRQSGNIPSTIHIIDFANAPAAFSLMNYEYSFAEGWIPVRKYRPEVPLDATMLLGKIFTLEERVDAIKALEPVDSEPVVVNYNTLPECLRSMPNSELNGLLRKNLSCSCKIAGSFPEDVGIFKK